MCPCRRLLRLTYVFLATPLFQEQPTYHTVGCFVDHRTGMDIEMLSRIWRHRDVQPFHRLRCVSNTRAWTDQFPEHYNVETLAIDQGILYRFIRPREGLLAEGEDANPLLLSP